MLLSYEYCLLSDEARSCCPENDHETTPCKTDEARHPTPMEIGGMAASIAPFFYRLSKRPAPE